MQRFPFLRVHTLPRRNPPTGLKIRGGTPKPEAVLMALSGYPGVDTTAPGQPAKYSPDLLAAFAAAMEAAKEDIISGLLAIEVDPTLAASLADMYYPYQLAAIAYFTERSTIAGGKFRAGVFDPVGVGKTPTGIGCALAAHGIASTNPDVSKRRPVFPVIVIRPESAQGSWIDDINRFTGKKAGILEVKTPTDVASISQIRRTGRTDKQGRPVLFVTMSYDTAADNIEFFLHQEGGGSYTPTMVILDEAHLLKDATSLRAQAVEKLTRSAHRVLLLTATPALSSAFEALPLLRMIDGVAYSPAQFDAEQNAILAATGDEGFQVRTGLMDATLQTTVEQGLTPELRKRAVRRSRAEIVKAGAIAGHPAQQFMQVDPIVAPIQDDQKKVISAATSVFTRGSPQAQKFFSDWNSFTYAMDVFIRSVLNKPLTKKNAKALADAWLSAPDQQRALSGLSKLARSGYTTIAAKSYQAIGLSNVAEAYAYAVKNPSLSGVFMCEHDAVARELYRLLAANPLTAQVELVTGSHRKRSYAQISQDWTIANIAASGPRWLVATRTANAGLNLTGADYLILVERLTSPGLEEQAEGRINRTGRLKQVDIKHIIAADLQAIVQANRIENRRQSLMWLMGEKPGDDHASRYSISAVRTLAKAQGTPYPSKNLAVFEAMDDPLKAARKYIIKGLT